MTVEWWNDPWVVLTASLVALRIGSVLGLFDFLIPRERVREPTATGEAVTRRDWAALAHVADELADDPATPDFEPQWEQPPPGRSGRSVVDGYPEPEPPPDRSWVTSESTY